MNAIPVFFSQNLVADADSFSPSSSKPAHVMTSWLKSGFPLDVVVPTPVNRKDLYRSHTRPYVDDVLDGHTDNGFGSISAELSASFLFTCGAMLGAARSALANAQVAVAPVSGFHHAGYRHGGGYCTFNGLMVTALALLESKEAQRVGILDYDYHYGDGTDDILKQLSIKKVIHVTAGKKYQGCFQGKRAEEFLMNIPADIGLMKDCDVLLYQAGADPHINDPLGGWLTSEQLKLRDRIVFEHVKERRLPIAWNLAGGYQKPLRKVLDIHDETMRQAVSIFVGGASRPTF